MACQFCGKSSCNEGCEAYRGLRRDDPDQMITAPACPTTPGESPEPDPLPDEETLLADSED